MDKISGLPDELLVKILSFLPTHVAVSTSVLSKRWQFLWMWLTKLDYWSGCSDFIDKYLPLHRAPVIESLSFYLRYDEPEDVSRWVEIAASRYVRELGLCYDDDDESESTVPCSLFSCKSLVILKLEDASLMDVPSMVCFPSLKSLQLKRVIYADENTIQKFLSTCPVLEDLDLELRPNEKGKGFTVNVPSLQKLSLYVHYYSISDEYGIEIDTPSLKYLKLYHRNNRTLFKNMPELREANIDVDSDILRSLIGSITSVQLLTICSEGIYGNGFVFDQLEHLKLHVHFWDTTTLLPRLLKDSPNLRVLDISMDFDDEGDVFDWTLPGSVPECMLSSLETFNWSGFIGRDRDHDIVAYIMKNARHLKKVTILADTWRQRRGNMNY